MLEFAKYHKTQMAYIIAACLRDIDELIKRMRLYKPYNHFNYPHYYRYMRNLQADTNDMRATVDFVMGQFPNYPKYP